MLATEDFIGHKGGNAIVQAFINDFWAEVGSRLRESPRVVAGVPDAFVAVVDRALVELVGVAERIAHERLLAREEEASRRERDAATAIEEARTHALAADQLRLRAEGERDALQTEVSSLRADNRALQDSLRERDAHVAQVQQSADLARLETDEARRALADQKAANAQAVASHQAELERLVTGAAAERARLLQQLDDDRQAAKREARSLQTSLEALRTTMDGLRADLATAREANVALSTRTALLDQSVSLLEAKLAAAATARETAERDALQLAVRLRAAEERSAASERRVAEQDRALGELNARLAQAEKPPFVPAAGPEGSTSP